MLHIRTSLFAFLTIFSIQQVHAAQIAQIKSVVENYAKLEEYTSQKNLDGAQKFIDTIVDINAQALYNKETILMKAVKSNNIMGLKLLLDRADIKVNSTNNDGETPLQVAMQECLYAVSLGTHRDVVQMRCDIVKQLGSKGAVFNTNKFKIVNEANNFSPMTARLLEDALLSDYHDGLAQCDSIKKEHAVYEQTIAQQLHEHIPVRDLNNIISGYNKISLLEFALTHKQAELQAQQK